MDILAAERARHVRRGAALEWAGIGYNCLEALIALAAGILAGSVALVGFGLDSVIEVTSSSALLWRLRADADHAARERAEGASLKIVGSCFLVLAVYVAWEAAESLLRTEAPRPSVPGILLAIASLVVMPLLSRAKRRVAGQIRSAALAADSKQTELCAWLSAILLAGLVLNAAFGWWWADPVAGLVMTPIIAREGIAALRGRSCCDCH